MTESFNKKAHEPANDNSKDDAKDLSKDFHFKDVNYIFLRYAPPT